MLIFGELFLKDYSDHFELENGVDFIVDFYLLMDYQTFAYFTVKCFKNPC